MRSVHAAKRGTPALDPGIVAFLERMGIANAPPWDSASVHVEEVRRNSAQSRAPLNLGAPALPDVRDLAIATLWGPVSVRVLRGSLGSSKPALLYLHGGGWTIGSIDTHHRLAAEYAAATGLTVINVDYALAPESPFPAALLQCVAVMASLRSISDELGIDPARIAVGGDSAGANLAVGLCLMLREFQVPLPCAALLTYGVYDANLDRPSYKRFGHGNYLLTREKMAWFWDMYVPAAVSRRHPLASPLQANLSALPPLHLTIAECDILADENRAFARKAAEAGVSVDVARWPGTVHGFIEGSALASVSRDAIRVQCDWLARQCS